MAPIITRYDFRAEVPQNVKIALISDLHDGNGPSLLELLRREAPDLICIAGDLTERKYHCVSTSEDREEYEYYYLHNVSTLQKLTSRLIHLLFEAIFPKKLPNGDPGLRFLGEAVKMAPVCYSTGNHEWFLQEGDRAEIRATGAHLLENEDCQPLPGIRVGGMPTRHDAAWLERFCAKDGYKLLLCHHPEYYPWLIQGRPGRTPDLICAGHAHGGQWRFFGRGVYAPGQGFFPKYSHGLYDGRLLVSSGCAVSSRIPRFGNPPELVIITLKAH